MHNHHFQDPTAPHYMFQDDPYLTPRTSPEFVSNGQEFFGNVLLLFSQFALMFFLSSTEIVLPLPGVWQNGS